MSITEAFAVYTTNVIAFKGQSPKTEETHNVCRKALIKYYGDIEIEFLTFEMVRDWKLSLDKRVSSSTCREYIIRLRVVLAYLQTRSDKVLDYNLIPVPKRPDKVPDFISRDDVSRLIEAVLKPKRGYPLCNMYRNAAIISLLYASGIRVTECASMDRSSIRDDNTFTVVGKGKKARLCFIDERTRELLSRYLSLRTDSNPALFISNEKGLRLTTKVIQTIFRLAGKKAGFTKPIHPHILRHSFATDLLRNNANMRYVQTMLGHSSLQTTQMYSHVVDVDLRRVYDECHKV